VSHISCIIPVKNRGQLVLKAIESALRQDVSGLEIVVVDDGSTDKSCEIIESIKDDRIHLIHKKNGGVSSARNRGIQEAKGEFIAFLDADDEWLPNKLEKQYILHKKNPKLIWSSSGYILINKNRKDKKIIFHKEGVLSDAIYAIKNIYKYSYNQERSFQKLKTSF